MFMNKNELRIIFMGTPSISAYVLRRMIESGFNIVAVISQVDKPTGRKHLLTPTPTKEVALEYNIPVYQKDKIRLDYDFVKEINPDLILTLAYGQILPQGLLDIPQYGCLNLHGSLLPKYRGAAPIQYALINNEKETGMCLMEMTSKMDAGKVYAKKALTIEESDNTTTLFNKLAEVAYQLVEDNLLDYVNGNLPGVEQDESLVTFAPTIKKEEEHLDLSKPVESIYGYIRALSDSPGAYLDSQMGKIKVFKSKIVSFDIKGELGEIIQADKSGIYLQCSNGILSLLELQKEGKSRLNYKDFLNGNKDLLHLILK